MIFKIKTYSLISILILIVSCKSYEVEESYKYDYYIFNGDQINFSNGSFYENKNNHLLLVKREKYIYDSNFLKKEFEMIRGHDTMVLFCFCNSHRNYYFDNLKFKKGTYFVDVQKNNLPIRKGDRLSKNSRKIKLKDFRTINPNPVLSQKELVRKDAFIKDLEFDTIDFLDAVKVKLIPMTKEKFWDNAFLPIEN